MPNSDDAEALRSDLATLLRVVAGDSTDGAVGGCEHAMGSFIGHAVRLQQSFAAARVRAAEAESAVASTSVATLREEIAALRSELDAKEALLASHRERCIRWKAECDAVRAGAEGLIQVQTAKPVPLEDDVDSGEAAAPEPGDDPMDEAGEDDGEDGEFDEFD